MTYIVMNLYSLLNLSKYRSVTAFFAGVFYVENVFSYGGTTGKKVLKKPGLAVKKPWVLSRYGIGFPTQDLNSFLKS